MTGDPLPEFHMPGCWRHFFKHRWWCRACDREVESQFRDVCDAFWRSDRRYNELADHVDDLPARSFAASVSQEDAAAAYVTREALVARIDAFLAAFNKEGQPIPQEDDQ